MILLFVKITDPDNREYIASIENISGREKTIPAIMILYRALILEKVGRRK